MDTARLKKLYKLSDEKLPKLQEHFGFRDTLTTQQFERIDEFLCWWFTPEQKQKPFEEAIAQWEAETPVSVDGLDLIAVEGIEEKLDIFADVVAQQMFDQLPEMAVQARDQIRQMAMQKVRSRFEALAAQMGDPKVFEAQMRQFMDTGSLGELQGQALSALPSGTNSNNG